MITRKDIIIQAIEECMKELFKWAQPKVTWEEFRKENKEYDGSGPKPYEFYYLDKDITKEIVENYAYAYRIGPELKDTITILIDYFEHPIVDKYISKHTDENGNYHPGHRGYDYPESIVNFIGEEHWDKVKEYFNMAGNFYKWDSNLQMFNINVYLGASPNSNKQAVIDNWKKYKNKDIEIKDISLEEFDEEYYGDF